MLYDRSLLFTVRIAADVPVPPPPFIPPSPPSPTVAMSSLPYVSVSASVRTISSLAPALRLHLCGVIGLCLSVSDSLHSARFALSLWTETAIQGQVCSRRGSIAAAVSYGPVRLLSRLRSRWCTRVYSTAHVLGRMWKLMELQFKIRRDSQSGALECMWPQTQFNNTSYPKTHVEKEYIWCPAVC